MDFKNALLENIKLLQDRTKPGYKLKDSDVLGSRRFEDLTMLQLKIFYDLIAQGKSVLANDLLKTALIEVNTKSREQATAALIPDAIEILMPRYHELNFENLMELRDVANPELMAMREYIDALALEFAPDDINSRNAKLHLKTKINPSIRDLENKVKGLKIGTLQKSIQTLMDPRVLATPILLATFIPNIPALLGVAVSLGIAGADAGLEYLKQKIEIESHPLYFSLGLRKKSGKYAGKV